MGDGPICWPGLGWGKGGSGWSELGLSFMLSAGIVFANMVRYING